jgi:PAS domain S-box-containing protein
MLGYDSADEVLALWLPDDLYVDPTERERLRAQYEPLGVLEGIELRWKKKDGTPIIVSLYAQTVHNAQGTLIGYEGMVLDITKRKQVEEELLRLSIAVRMSTDSIVLTDLGGKITEVNEAALRMYGTDEKRDLVGRSAFEFIVPEEQSQAFVEMAETLEKGYIKDRRYHAITKNGSRVPVEMSAALMTDRKGKPTGFVGIIRDITERKRAEALLQQEVQIFRGQTAALTRTLKALSAEPTLDTFLGQVLTAIAQQLQAHWAMLWLHDPLQDTLSLHMRYKGGEILSAAQLRDPAMEDLPPAHIPLPWRQLVRTRRPLVVEDVERDPRILRRELLLAQGVKTLLLVPLVLADEVIGILSLRSTEPRCYRPEELELAQALSQQVMLAMQLTRLTEQAQQAAILEERNRIAREIHDTLAQGFTGIVLHLEAAKRALTAAPEKARTRLDEACALARESLAEARRSVMALRPLVLEHDDLPIALSRLAIQLAVGTQTRIAFHVHGTARSLPVEVENNLLRISQEALTNACRHAQAQKIEIDLTFGRHQVRLRVQDDGRGFDVQELVVGNGFGLTSMRERAERVGGQYSLTSRPGQGTEVEVVVPYPLSNSSRMHS